MLEEHACLPCLGESEKDRLQCQLTAEFQTQASNMVQAHREDDDE